MKWNVAQFLRPPLVVFAICAIIATVRLTGKKCAETAAEPALATPQLEHAAQAPAPTQAPQRLNLAQKLESISNAMPREEHRLLSKKVRTNYTEVWMSPLEVNLALRYLDGVQTYLEWGSGGSTLNLAQFAEKSAVSIEHDADWCEMMRRRVSGVDRLRRLTYHCVPVPRGHRGWGLLSGFEEGNYVVFKEYVDQIDKAGHELYDFVLVDGRARVAAAIKALSYVKPESSVVLHDSRRLGMERYAYSKLLEYYYVKDSCEGKRRQGLAVLRRRGFYHYLQGNHSAVQEILDDMHNGS